MPSFRLSNTVPQRWKITSLEGNLTFLIILIVLFVVGAVTYVANLLSVEALERDSLQTASEIAGGLASRLQSGIPESLPLQELLTDHVNANFEIETVAVFRLSPNGELVLAAFAGPEVQRSAEQKRAAVLRRRVSRQIRRDGDRLWSLGVPVLSGESLLGVIGVWSSLKAADLFRRQNRRRAYVAAPLSVLVVVVLLRLVFARFVHRPIRELEQAMERAEGGDLQAEAKVFRQDELGFIANRYNATLARVRASTEEREKLVDRIQRLNQRLSQKVMAATVELRERNRELRRLNEDLYYLQRRLALIERLSGAQQMATMIAHKVGTPLNLISGHIQVLQQERTDDPALQKKLQLLRSQIDRLTAIVRDALDETRKPDLELQPIDLNELLDRILTITEPTLTTRQIVVVRRLRTDLPAIDGDEAQLEQVFLSLLNNSLDAMPQGGTITVEMEKTDRKVRVRFSDSGEGIPEGVLAQIFRPFFTTKDVGRGTGLGLAIVREILTAHGAGIETDSVVGRGTAFVIDFPQPHGPEKGVHAS